MPDTLRTVAQEDARLADIMRRFDLLWARNSKPPLHSPLQTRC